MAWYSWMFIGTVLASGDRGESAHGQIAANESRQLYSRFAGSPLRGLTLRRGGLIPLQASTRPRTDATDFSNIAFSSAENAISTMRSTPPAPITIGTPT